MPFTTTYSWGDVLLVNFPQTGTSQRKRRPAIVILDIGDADLVLAPITTKQRTGPGDQPLSDWAAAGLLAQSWVRLAKIATLEKSDVVRRLGQLTDPDKFALAAAWRQPYVLSDYQLSSPPASSRAIRAT
jgi:mRNA interferase MazF